MTTTAMVAAKERQLDWLLAEVLGGVTVHRERSAPRRSRSPAQRWLAAAVVVLAAGAAVGTALLHSDEAANSAQQPQGEGTIPWHEAHGTAALATVPADVRNLRCFDFDDTTIAELAKFPQLERLDLCGTDVNEQGYSMTSPITDTGVAELGKLVNLRWLSLASCQKLEGTGLVALENLPKLEHLDLTSTYIKSPAVERLARLPSLRELSLSYCMAFHGRSLAAIAKLPGLRRLDLQGCKTLSATDVLPLANLRELRYLDLRDCQGRFRGQTFSNGVAEVDVPKQDGIGITDASIAALANLPLETLLLGESESLTDGIGDTLAKMTTLRTLDLGGLTKITGALLAKVPPGLTSLSLDENRQFSARDLRRLPPLPGLREFGLGGLAALDDDTLRHLLSNKQLTTLRLDGLTTTGKGPAGVEVPPDLALTAAAAGILAQQASLASLSLSGNTEWVDGEVMAQLAKLPALRELTFQRVIHLDDAKLAKLGASRSLRTLRLVWCIRVREAGLRALADVPLTELDVYGTNLEPAKVQELAKSWPGCTIKLPKGQRFREPARAK